MLSGFLVDAWDSAGKIKLEMALPVVWGADMNGFQVLFAHVIETGDRQKIPKPQVRLTKRHAQ